VSGERSTSLDTKFTVSGAYEYTQVIVNDSVRGIVPPPWFWALSGSDRIRALSLSHTSPEGCVVAA
jgi:hypothetical protein